ncbi:hypothetical protein D3C71_1884760 [compost metagenome]
MRMAPSLALMRTVPEGVWRNWSTSASASSIAAIAGRSLAARPWPASVSETLRVVRLTSRTPSRCSSPLIEWLTADGVMSRSVAAPRKLARAATAKKTVNAKKSLFLD